MGRLIRYILLPRGRVKRHRVIDTEARAPSNAVAIFRFGHHARAFARFLNRPAKRTPKP